MKELYYPTEKDFDVITQIWEESVKATHKFLCEDDIRFYKALIRNNYLKEVELTCIKNESNDITAFMGIKGTHLEMLFIHPSQRGLGIGKFLITHAIDKLGIRTVDVNEQNSQAVGFYLHMGFGIIARDELDGMGKPFPILHLKYQN